MEGADRTGQIDRTDRLPGVGVVDRGRRAGEAVVLRDQVLRGVDLHRGARGQRGAHRVGAGGVLAPAEALGQLDVVGDVQHPGRALAPQDVPRGVGDDHDVHRLVGDLEQRRAQDRQHRRERVGLAQGGELAVVEDVGQGRRGPGRRGRRASAARSRADHRARGDLAVPAGEHRVADAGHHGRPLDRVAPDQRVGPRTAGNSRHPPPRGVVLDPPSCAVRRRRRQPWLARVRRSAPTAPGSADESAASRVQRPCNARRS